VKLTFYSDFFAVENIFFNAISTIEIDRIAFLWKTTTSANYGHTILARFSTFLSTGKAKTYPQIFHRMPVNKGQ